MIEKLYIIFTIFGQIGAVAGPLPYDEEECIYRTTVRQTEIQEKYDPINPPTIDGRIVTLEDLKFECVWKSERPQLGAVF